MSSKSHALAIRRVNRAADRHIAAHGLVLTDEMAPAVELEIRRRQMAKHGMTSATTTEHVVASVLAAPLRPRRTVASAREGHGTRPGHRRPRETRAGPDDSDPEPAEQPPAGVELRRHPQHGAVNARLWHFLSKPLEPAPAPPLYVYPANPPGPDSPVSIREGAHIAAHGQQLELPLDS